MPVTTIDVPGGKFITDDSFYAPFASPDDGGMVGAQMTLFFVPKADLDATEVHLVQTVKDLYREEDQDAYDLIHQGNTGFTVRIIQVGEHKGVGIDMEFHGPYDDHLKKVMRARERPLLDLIETNQDAVEFVGALERQQTRDQIFRSATQVSTPSIGALVKNKTYITSLDPRYAQQRLSLHVPAYVKQTTEGTTGWGAVRSDPVARTANWTPGWRASGWGPSAARGGAAALRDLPSVPVASVVTGMVFEVAVLAEGGSGTRFVGSVSWGWEREPLARASDVSALAKVADSASAAFFAAATHFNSATVEDFDGTEKPPMELPTG